MRYIERERAGLHCYITDCSRSPQLRRRPRGAFLPVTSTRCLFFSSSPHPTLSRAKTRGRARLYFSLISQLARAQCERNYVTLINPLFRPLLRTPSLSPLISSSRSLSLSLSLPFSASSFSRVLRMREREREREHGTPMKRKWVTLLPFVEDFTENLRASRGDSELAPLSLARR